MRRFSTYLYALLIVCLGVVLGPQPGYAIAARQDAVQTPATSAVTLTILQPVNAGAATLHTHIVDIGVTPTGDGNLSVELNSTYVLRNEGADATTVEFSIPVADGHTPTIFLDGAPLATTPGAGGALLGVAAVPAEGAAEVTLADTWTIADRGLIEIRYPSDQLHQWPGAVSLRVDLRPDSGIPPESWLRVEPDGWRYAPPDVSPYAAVEWLYDGNPPDGLLFQAFSPALWSQVVQAEQAAGGNAPPDAAAGLGNLYRQLAEDAGAGEDPAAGERFYAQALAAYESGLQKAVAAGATDAQTAALHAGLASLYRSRVVDAAGGTNVAYAELMVTEAGLALRGLMADDALRPELDRWRTEGLRLLLTDARRRGDVDSALAIIDRLSAADDGGNTEFLASERRALVIQQALELLDRGDREGAVALAGDVINDPNLQPSGDLQPLFRRWAIEVAVNGDGIQLRTKAFLDPVRTEEGRAAFHTVIDSWRSAENTDQFDVELSDVREAGSSDPYLELTMRIPKGDTGVPLGDMLPTNADWALLRLLLTQLGPKLDSSSQGLYQQVQMTQPMDLRSVGDQWEAVAQSLEQQAVALEAESQATGAGVDATMEASLQSRVRAANLRQMSERWRDLSRDSLVQISLATAGSMGNAARTWLVTVESAPQMLDVVVESLSPGRVALLAAGILLALVVLASMLWRLL